MTLSLMTQCQTCLIKTLPTISKYTKYGLQNSLSKTLHTVYAKYGLQMLLRMHAVFSLGLHTCIACSRGPVGVATIVNVGRGLAGITIIVSVGEEAKAI